MVYLRELNNLLVKNSLSIQSFYVCWFIYNKDLNLFYEYRKAIKEQLTKEFIDNLIERGYVTISEEGKYLYSNLSVTKKFLGDFGSVLGPSSNTDKVEEWFGEWYDIFPRGIKSGGYPVKGDRKGCIRKLKQFQKEYPEFSKETILEATKLYVEESRKNGFKFMQLAHYFVFKNRNSSLAGYCELVEDKKNLPEESFETLPEDELATRWDFLRDI